MNDKQPPQMPQIQVDITKGKDIRCENEGCGNYTFQECVMLKEFSAITSPNGKPGIVPIPVFACNACGFVNNQFLPAFMRKTADPVHPTSITTSMEAPPSPSKLKLV